VVCDTEEHLQIYNTAELETASEQGLIIELLKDMVSIPYARFLSRT
jgi:hypothetical protein